MYRFLSDISELTENLVMCVPVFQILLYLQITADCIMPLINQFLPEKKTWNGLSGAGIHGKSPFMEQMYQ